MEKIIIILIFFILLGVILFLLFGLILPDESVDLIRKKANKIIIKILGEEKNE